MLQIGPGPLRWQLFVDCVIFWAVAAICTLFIGGLGDCGSADSTAEIANCYAFGRDKVYTCVVVACFIFPFWLRKKLRCKNDR